MVEYCSYEIGPVEDQTPETFSLTMRNVYKWYLKNLERGAQRLAAGLDPKPDCVSVTKESYSHYVTNSPWILLDQARQQNPKSDWKPVFREHKFKDPAAARSLIVTLRYCPLSVVYVVNFGPN